MKKNAWLQALLTLLTLSSVSGSAWAMGKTQPPPDSKIQFPSTFKWCVATAAYQVEGNDINSDWWDWEQTPGHIANNDKSGLACDEWNRLPEDIGMMKDLGVGVYRFSVEWAKIEPVEGQYDAAAIAHYQDEIRQLADAGITPFITLHHFTLPRWLRAKGGWEWEGAPDAFEQFTRLVYSKIARGTRDWVTFNEPMVHALKGYVEGTMPGETRPIDGIFPVIRGLLRAHAQAYHALHELAAEAGADVRVGMAHHLRTFDPYAWINPLDDLMSGIIDQSWNWTVPEALETGRLKLHMLWVANDDEEIPGLKGTQDFIGVNYYSGDLIQFSPSKGFVTVHHDLPRSDAGWDIYPEGLLRVLQATAKRIPGKPILITENGIADASDTKRPDFIRDHLRYLSQAIQEGIPVEGYCYWAPLDNFEWVDGFTRKYGLYETNFVTQTRTPRGSAKLFHDIIQNEGF